MEFVEEERACAGTVRSSLIPDLRHVPLEDMASDLEANAVRFRITRCRTGESQVAAFNSSV